MLSETLGWVEEPLSCTWFGNSPSRQYLPTLTRQPGKGWFFQPILCRNDKVRAHPSQQKTLSSVYPDDAEANYLSTTAEEVLAAITSLKLGKACGLDDLSPEQLLRCDPGVANSLPCIFNRSFRECQVPTAWKTALIVPVNKGGSKSSLSNYRPIAFLIVVSKLIEKIADLFCA